MRYRPSRQRYVTSSELAHALAATNKRIDALEASEQGQIDAITAELTTVATDLGTAQTTLQTEIDSIVAGNPPNLDALTAVAASLDPLVQTVAGLVPTPPADAPPAV